MHLLPDVLSNEVRSGEGSSLTPLAFLGHSGVANAYLSAPVVRPSLTRSPLISLGVFNSASSWRRLGTIPLELKE